MSNTRILKHEFKLDDYRIDENDDLVSVVLVDPDGGSVFLTPSNVTRFKVSPIPRLGRAHKKVELCVKIHATVKGIAYNEVGESNFMKFLKLFDDNPDILEFSAVIPMSLAGRIQKALPTKY